MSGTRSNQLDIAMDRIAALDWEAPAAAHLDTTVIFSALDVPSLLSDRRDSLVGVIDVEKSVEKTTHYKWFVAEDANRRFQLWLHEYKPGALRREGHATVAHNHRFWLSSLIVRGGFTDHRFQRATDPSATSITKLSSSRLTAGDTMVIAPDEIHALSDLSDGTISLIAQGHPIRKYSEVFEGGAVRRYPDLDAKLAELRASLRD